MLVIRIISLSTSTVCPLDASVAISLPRLWPHRPSRRPVPPDADGETRAARFAAGAARSRPRSSAVRCRETSAVFCTAGSVVVAGIVLEDVTDVLRVRDEESAPWSNPEVDDVAELLRGLCENADRIALDGRQHPEERYAAWPGWTLTSGVNGVHSNQDTLFVSVSRLVPSRRSYLTSSDNSRSR